MTGPPKPMSLRGQWRQSLTETRSRLKPELLGVFFQTSVTGPRSSPPHRKHITRGTLGFQNELRSPRAIPGGLPVTCWVRAPCFGVPDVPRSPARRKGRWSCHRRHEAERWAGWNPRPRLSSLAAMPSAWLCLWLQDQGAARDKDSGLVPSHSPLPHSRRLTPPSFQTTRRSHMWSEDSPQCEVLFPATSALKTSGL